VGFRTSLNVALDWTEFDADGQATIMLSLLTRHGRATPLMWLTVDKSTLKNHRNEYEYQVLVRLAEALPADVKVPARSTPGVQRAVGTLEDHDIRRRALIFRFRAGGEREMCRHLFTQ
jgi:hypothetical protein